MKNVYITDTTREPFTEFNIINLVIITQVLTLRSEFV